MVDGKGRAKIHIDRGAVGGRAARDAGVLPQLQLSKAHQGHAAAVFRLTAGDRSVQNRYLVCMAADIQAAAVFACLAVLDAAAGDPDGAICAIMVALYITQDSFGTACNVSGDNAIGVIVDTIYKKFIVKTPQEN